MKVPAKGTPLRQRMIEDMGIRNLSPATQYNYINCVAKYALHFGKSPAVLGPEHIRGYQVHLTQVKRVSWSVFNTAVCALRFLYRITLQKDWAVEHIPYPKKPKRLPEVLSLDEVWRFLEFITNLKYRALLRAQPDSYCIANHPNVESRISSPRKRVLGLKLINHVHVSVP